MLALEEAFALQHKMQDYVLERLAQETVVPPDLAHGEGVYLHVDYLEKLIEQCGVSTWQGVG